MDLNETVSSLWDHALSTNTLKSYQTALQSFKTFLLQNNLAQTSFSLPVVTDDVIMLYIAHCYKNLRLKYTTIKLYLCGIRFAYMKDGVSCPLTQSDSPCHSRIMTVLKAVKRVQGHSVKLRQPITATILDQICTVLSTGYISDYTDSLLTAVCLSAFFGFLRCGEFTVPTDSAFDPTINLCLGDLTFHNNHANLLLKSSKTDPFRQGVTVPLFRNEAHTKLCPYQALRTYISKRMDKLPYHQDKTSPLFLTEDRHPLTRPYFINNLKHILSKIGLDTSMYSGHSFRIGAASSGCSARLEDHLLKTLGRWSSNAYQTYIRTPQEIIQSAQMALLTELNV